MDYNIQDYNMAIADFTEAIRLDSNDAYIYNLRGLSYEKKGDKNKAIADFEAALKLEPNNTKYSNNLIRVRGW